MNILALNPGSATLKYRLVATEADESRSPPQFLGEGLVEHAGGDSLGQATEEVVGRCRGSGVAAVGCRVVHGGARFREPTLVTNEVWDEIEALNQLAPLHNPLALAAITTCRSLLPDIPIVAIFDTAFHRTLPAVACTYALPFSLCEQFGLQRYGFHGISHGYVARTLIAHLGEGKPASRVITCHLGNGASLSAVRDGQSVDTSMGMTPLEGLVMGTRSGDVDPGLLLHLQTEQGWSPARLDEVLNQQSGLLGVSGVSHDLREVTRAAEEGNERALLALDLHAYRVRKYLGAYVVVLGGVDAVAFSGGIGEHSASMRERICKDLEFLGIRLDLDRNNKARGPEEPARISAEDGAVAVWVVPTDEEREIAHQTAAFLRRGGGR
jgi:acetate kinase